MRFSSGGFSNSGDVSAIRGPLSDAPERPCTLLDLSDGEVLWKAFYDRDDRPSGRLRRQVGRFIGQERDLGRTAVEVAHEEAVEMVSELVDRVR